jgi:hypothetical protein
VVSSSTGMRSFAQLLPTRPPLVLYSQRCRGAETLITDRTRRLSRALCSNSRSLLPTAWVDIATSLVQDHATRLEGTGAESPSEQKSNVYRHLNLRLHARRDHAFIADRGCNDVLVSRWSSSDTTPSLTFRTLLAGDGGEETVLEGLKNLNSFPFWTQLR